MRARCSGYTLASIAGGRLSLWDLRRSAARVGRHDLAHSARATALAAGPRCMLAVADGRGVALLRACAGADVWNLS